MDLIDTVGQKTKSETPRLRPRGLKFETPRRKETQENEISRLIQIRDWNKIFRDPEFSGTNRLPTNYNLRLRQLTHIFVFLIWWMAVNFYAVHVAKFMANLTENILEVQCYQCDNDFSRE